MDRTFAASKEQSLAQLSGSSERGNGNDAHAPIGLSSGDRYRELIQFDHDWDARPARNGQPAQPAVAQIERVELELTRTSGVHVSFGGSPRVRSRRVKDAWTAGGGDEGTWSTGASTKWPGPDTADAGQADKALASTSADGVTTLDITEIYEAIAPATIMRRDGTPCGGQGNKGIAVWSWDHDSASRTTEFYSMRAGAAWRRPRVRVTFNGNHRPSAPTITSPVGDTTPEMIASATGTEDVTTFYFVDEDAGDSCVGVDIEYHGAGATDEAPNLLRSVSTAPTVVNGSQRLYSVRVTGLSARTQYRKRLRTRDSSGKNTSWGPWTSLADGLIQTAYQARKPASPFMESSPDRPHVFGTIDSDDRSDFITGWEGEFFRDDPAGRVTLWAPGKQEIGGSPSRSDIEYAGATLLAGQVVRWRHRHYNRDGVAGDWSEFYTRVIASQDGPSAMSPLDTGTKLLSRTATLTIGNSASFDGYQWRLYRAGAVIFDSGLLTVGSTTSQAVNIPDGLVSWGEDLAWDAAIRLAGSGALGTFSPQRPIYINSLPSTTLTAKDADGNTGTVLGTTDIIWSSPYIDQDRARYGERPVAKLLEVRHAATPQGSGALVDQRLGIDDLLAAFPIPEDEHSGYQLLPLTTASGWTPEADVSVGTVADAPTDYTGNSLRITFASSSANRGMYYYLAEPMDLTGFSSHAFQMIHRKLSSESGLTRLAMGFEDSAGRWIEWTIYDPATDSTGAWDAEFPFLGFTDDWSGSGDPDIDLTDVTALYVWAYCSGTFAATLDLRDWRIGFEVKDSDPPDATYGIEFEESYDARVRYRDDADALATTQLAAASSATATNIKVDSVTGLVAGQDITIGGDDERLQETRVIGTVGTAGSGGTGVTLTEALFYDHADDSPVNVYPWGAWTAWRTVRSSEPPAVAADTPADAAVISDPTPALVHTYTSGAAKAQASHTLRVDRIRGYMRRAIAMRPLSAWGMGESTGPFVDLVGDVDGTVAGSPTRAVDSLVSGDPDPAFRVNAGSGSVGFGDVYGFEGTDHFSVAAVVDVGTWDAHPSFLDKGHWTFYGWNDHKGPLLSRTDGSGTDYCVPDAAFYDSLATGTHLVVGTYDGTTLRVYVDGELAGSTASSRSVTHSASALTVGGGAGTFDIDGAVVWDRALSATEIATLYASLAETPDQQFIYSRTTDGTGLTDTGPAFLLETGATYAWEVTAADTDGLEGTTDERTFLTSFTVPEPVRHITAVADPDSSAVQLTWDRSFDINGTFETDVSGWVATSGATIARSTAEANSGTACMRITGSGVSDYDGAEYALTGTFRSGSTYRFSVNASLISGSADWALKAVDGDGEHGSDITPDGSFGEIHIDYTPASDQTSVAIRIRLRAHPASVLAIDDVTVDEITEIHHYRVWWEDGAGQWIRVDDGPRTLDDGRTPLTDVTFTHHGARLGENHYHVTAHNGWAESEPASVVVELTPATGGSWMFVRPGVERLTFPLRALQAVPRVHQAAVERFAPPGRGSTVHLKWGATGKRVSVRTMRRPADDGDLSMRLAELQAGDLPGWVKSPEGWAWDPMWCQVVEVTDEPGVGGMLGISIEFETTELP